MRSLRIYSGNKNITRNYEPRGRIIFSVTLLLIGLTLSYASAETLPTATAFLNRLDEKYRALKSYSYQGDYFEVYGAGKQSSSSTIFSFQHPDKYRVEVLAGRGKGVVITTQGDKAVVRPSKRLPFLKVNYRINDPQLRSYRGRGLLEGNLLYYLKQIKPKTPDDSLTLNEMTLGAVNARRLALSRKAGKDADENTEETHSLTVDAETLQFINYEVRLKGVLVEKEDFKDLKLGLSFPPETFSF